MNAAAVYTAYAGRAIGSRNRVRRPEAVSPSSCSLFVRTSRSMSGPPTTDSHLHDRQRLRSLAVTGFMDAPERDALSRYARIATRALGATVSLVSLVDEHRQFFAA